MKPDLQLCTTAAASIMSAMERQGCFVFHVEDDAAVSVRSQPSSSDDFVTNIKFFPGELIAVDLIRKIDRSTSLLRLSDGTGWILQKGGNLKSLYVESDIFTLVVDHFPSGLTARSNPNERDEFRLENVYFRPLEKVFCDQRVTHPETSCIFYRLQGTNHWVFDRKFDAERKSFDPTLLEDHYVISGSFAYVAYNTVAIRSIPSLNQEFKTGLDIHKGEIIMVNIIRDSPQGSWLRLACSTGWVPEARGRRSNFEQVDMEDSLWSFRVLNHPIGIQLRAHPLDERDEKLVATKSFEDRQQIDFPKLSVLVEPETIVDCDMKIASPTTGVNWYRIADTKGWIFDRRNGKPTIEPYKRSSRKLREMSSTHWTVDFIRGMAAMMEGLQEVRHNDSDFVILFHKGNLQVKIWYKLRTITVFVDRPKQDRLQVSRNDCSKEDLIEIMKNPKHVLSGNKVTCHPTSPRSTAEFINQPQLGSHNVYDETDDSDEPKSPSRHVTRYKSTDHKTALLKYGAKFHRPHVSAIRSMDESQVAIKGSRQSGRSVRSGDSGRLVKVPSDASSTCTIATGKGDEALHVRHLAKELLARNTEAISGEEELESRQDLLLLEKEIFTLLDSRQTLIQALRACEQRRSEEAQQLHQQTEVVQRKLDPLVQPGLVFWGPTFGSWKCDKCKEDCSDRNSLSQHIASTGH